MCFDEPTKSFLKRFESINDRILHFFREILVGQSLYMQMQVSHWVERWDMKAHSIRKSAMKKIVCQWILLSHSVFNGKLFEKLMAHINHGFYWKRHGRRSSSDVRGLLQGIAWAYMFQHSTSSIVWHLLNHGVIISTMELERHWLTNVLFGNYLEVMFTCRIPISKSNQVLILRRKNGVKSVDGKERWTSILVPPT